MFGSLPKLADKNFIIGFLLPVLLTVFPVLSLLRDVDAVAAIIRTSDRVTSFTDLTIMVLYAWSAATLLLVMNYPVIRGLEGYIGPLASDLLRQRRAKLFDQEQKQLDIDYMTAADRPDEAARRAYLERVYEIKRTLPPTRDLVMPTRFGNVIRAFENYPMEVYGLEAITAWPRLEGVLPKDYRALISDAQAEMNFFANICVLSTLVALLAAARGLEALVLAGQTGAFRERDLELTVWLLVAIATGYGAYEGAVHRARAWGDTVKGAFDLFAGKLANQLGYELPATREEREAFWDAVNCMFGYAQPMQPERWPRALTKPADPGASSGGGSLEDEE